ncbi:ABC transporter substrate-binding protein [Pseudomonas marginalis ICMP 9505]|nr:ABC transporter substrate-binding protein [Pseudomonas marginalis ICMP 9505]
MNSEEQTLIDGLFSRLQQAETDSAPRDAQAEARIKEHMTRQPAVGYYMTQSILVQEHAIKSLDAQNKQQAQQIQQLQDELQQARAQSAQPAQSSGGFLSSIFGGGSRDSQPAPSAQAPAGGGWREPARPSFGQPAPQQQNYAAPPQNYQQPAAAPVGSGFLGGALKTAAGVAGGVMLAEGISSLFHHNQQPQIVEEIIEQPAPASDQGNWGNDDQKFAGNDNWGSNNTDSFADNDYADDASSFGDDDSFV